MMTHFVRLLLLTIMFALALPAEMAKAQEETIVLAKRGKNKGKKKRLKNRRGKKRRAAAQKKNKPTEPVAIEPSPFGESDEATPKGSEVGEQDADQLEPDKEPENGEEGSKDTDGGLKESETGSKLNLNEDEAGDEADGSLRRSGRMEFDERLVKGQAAKSGAVYLFKRMPRRLPGLIPLRRSYRRRIVEPVLGTRPLKPILFSGKDTTGKKQITEPFENEEKAEEPLTPEAEQSKEKE